MLTVYSGSFGNEQRVFQWLNFTRDHAQFAHDVHCAISDRIDVHIIDNTQFTGLNVHRRYAQRNRLGTGVDGVID